MKPFGELSREEQLKLFSAWLDGKTIEVLDVSYDTGKWFDITNPHWCLNRAYRVKPEPKIPDSINWDHVASEYCYMVRRPDGGVVLATEKPLKYKELYWVIHGRAIGGGVFKSLVIGNLPWDQSLVERPNK